MSVMPRTFRVLLVEDEDSHALITTRTLTRDANRCVVDRAVDGADAIAYLEGTSSHGPHPEPDLVLLDLKLPKLSGHEVLARIKGDDRFRGIPVVILTTSDANPDRVRAYDHYANSYLVKPTDFLRFRQMIEDLLSYWGGWNRRPTKA